jgi:hypothetical protein
VPSPAQAAAGEVTPLPRRRRRAVPAVTRALPAGPTRRPGEVPVTELLRPRRPLDDEISPDAATPPMGFRPVATTTGEAALALPGRSTPLDPGPPLPKRIPDSGIPLPRRRPGLPLDAGPEPLPARLPERQALERSGGVGPLPPPEVPLAAAGPRSLPPPEDAIWPPLAPSRYRPAHQADQQAESPSERSRPEPRSAEPWPAESRSTESWPAESRSAGEQRTDQERADDQRAETPALPVPTIPAPPLAAAQRVSGPAMNDRVAGRIADMLRREAKRDNRGLTS